MFVILALQLLSPVATATEPSQTPQRHSFGVDEMTTKELADRLLVPEQARTIVSHTVFRDRMLGASSFALHTAPAAYGKDVCVRQRFGARIIYLPTKEATFDQLKAKARVAGSQIALGTDCGTMADAKFASINSDIPLEDAVAALRWLASAQIAARSRGRLPFTVQCRSSAPGNRCSSDARDTLRKLPLDQIDFLRPVAQDWHFWIRPAGWQDGGAVWDVNVHAVTGAAGLVRMHWSVPAPF